MSAISYVHISSNISITLRNLVIFSISQSLLSNVFKPLWILYFFSVLPLGHLIFWVCSFCWFFIISHTHLFGILTLSGFTKFCHISFLAFQKTLYSIVFLHWNDLSLFLFVVSRWCFCTLISLCFSHFKILHSTMPLVVYS